MLKVIDVDWLSDYRLALSFNDGFQGTIDLTEHFKLTPFADINKFKHFSLTPKGSLLWGKYEIKASELRQQTQGQQANQHEISDMTTLENTIKQAVWDSMIEGRPDILQAAIAAYVAKLGHSKVIAQAGIKSRTSAYKTLNPDTKPSFATLVQLGKAIIDLTNDKKQLVG